VVFGVKNAPCPNVRLGITSFAWGKFVKLQVFGIGLMVLFGCSAPLQDGRLTRLEVVQISPETNPERLGEQVVAWYPELGSAVLQVEATESTSNNHDAITISELPIKELSLQYTIASGNVWSSSWATWSSSWATWSSGGSVYKTEKNLETWNQIRLDQALLKFSKAGSGITVAILDTGIDMAHPAFVGRLVAPFDFVDFDAHPAESGGIAYGHGTNVAGIVAQVASKAKIMPIRVMKGDGRGSAISLISGINWAVKNGAKVINLSLGAVESSALEVAIKYATSKGVIVVSAAGNSGGETVQYPAFKSGSDGKNGIWGDLALGVASVQAVTTKIKWHCLPRVSRCLRLRPVCGLLLGRAVPWQPRWLQGHWHLVWQSIHCSVLLWLQRPCVLALQ
jgi:Subtilase family